MVSGRPFFLVSSLILWVNTAPSFAAEATLNVHAAELSPNKIPRSLTGKFCEHLGANIYNGMDAQILRNATFADFPFSTPQGTPDGIASFQWEPARIDDELRRQAQRYGWPESELAKLVEARHDGLACFWARTGSNETVQVSPDTGPYGGRAQRIELKGAGGIEQWTWLPLHRTRKYEFELLARSPDLTRLTISLEPVDSKVGCAVTIEGLTTEWSKLVGTLIVTNDAPTDSPYRLTLRTESAGQLVIAHLFLRPADHLNGADPDVVRFLKDSRLPLLRWPGGNFVSAYHWEDGVGPVEKRPTKPNYAWGGVEPNTFGTDEFISFCRAVGCDPMICINAGNGTPEEAARWIEYCNGTTNSPMGALRASNGHSEPYQVRYWEVGNELWGRWQAHWTTAGGYVDRYVRFVQAMRSSDPTIRLYACGAPVLWGKAWNDKLIGAAASQLWSITDHPLVGGDVPRTVEPLAVFSDFMQVPDILETKWKDLREDMIRGGVREPRLAVTELQMFAHLGSKAGPNETERLNRENLVNPGTLAEALYDTLIYHAAVRLQPFVEFVTHSATVNHGGGLRKERERVYANPCHYANSLFAEFAGAQPVKIELTTPKQPLTAVLPDVLRNVKAEAAFGVLDAVAALGTNGDLLISIVHRGSEAPVQVRLNVDGYAASENVVVWTLSGPVPWSANTLQQPDAVRPVRTEEQVRNGSLVLDIKPFSVVHIILTNRA